MRNVLEPLLGPPDFDDEYHTNPEKHLIGDALPAPSTVSTGFGNTVGTSPYPAREDHSHQIDGGTAFPTTNLTEGRVFARTDQKRTYVYTGGAWWRLGYWGGSGRYLSTLTRVAALNVNNTTDTDISWDTEVADSESSITVPITNIPVPNERVSNTLAGLWAVSGYVLWSAGPGGNANVRVVHSGGDTYQFDGTNGATTLYRGFSVPILSMSGAETFKISVFQNSGAARTVTAKLNFMWVSP